MAADRLRMKLSRQPYLWALCLLSSLLLACSDLDKVGISSLLDARDQAISHRNISEYSVLISSNYYDHERDKVQVVAQMLSLFDKFERAEMHSYDRQIRKLDNNLAQCEQSYTLKVFADGQWRQIIQCEQLTLAEGPGGWKIISGL
jgi:hypothetical protein